MHAEIAAQNAAVLSAPPRPKINNTLDNIKLGLIFALILTAFFAIVGWTNKPISCPVGTVLSVGDNGYAECEK
jgi:hypothetical protein